MPVFNDPIQNVCVFACARQGSSHKTQDTGVSPCQDAHLISSGAIAGRAYVVAAVADGHGSTRHDRSHIGAQLAAQAAVTAFQTFLLDHHDSDRKTLVTGFKRSFPTEVTREWRKAVQGHYANGQENTPLDYGRYGTTLLFAGMVDRVLFLAQIGDGDIVRTSCHDQQQDLPLFVKDGLVAGETFSLCSQDAEKLWRSTTCDLTDVAFVTLSTDGLRNAYDSTDAFLRLLSAIQKNVEQYDIGRATAILPESLDGFSARGSGDDITLVGLMIGPAPREMRAEPEALSSVATTTPAPESSNANGVCEVPNPTDSVPTQTVPLDNGGGTPKQTELLPASNATPEVR